MHIKKLKANWMCVMFGTSVLAMLFYKIRTISKTMDHKATTRDVYLPLCLSDFSETNSSVEYLQEIFSYISKKAQEDTACRNLHRTLTRVYGINKDRGDLFIPGPLREKLLRWLSGDKALADDVQDQVVIYVHNKVLEQGTIFNPLRQNRPQPAPDTSEHAQIEKLVLMSEKDCDLCNYEEYTAQDPFGHLHNDLAYTMANAFKLAAWNSMVVFHNHHPLAWSLQELESVFALAVQWFHKVHSASPSHRYPMILWDMLPGAGASQMHPHIHVIATTDQYYGEVERWRQRSAWYSATYGSSYFTDLLHISAALGLVVSQGNAHAISSLTPQMDKEIIFLADQPSTDLYQLVYHTIQVYQNSFKKYSFSLVLMLPPLGEESDLPVVGRIAPRAELTSQKSDISSLHLFAAPEVNTDPFRMMQVMREAIRKGMMKD